jgi:hypothetical protein
MLHSRLVVKTGWLVFHHSSALLIHIQANRPPVAEAGMGVTLHS